MGLVLVENLEVFANHGLFEEEQKVGRKFIVNLMVETDFSAAAENDDINGTVNYARLCDIIHEQMAIPSKLLEHVGNHILKAIKTEFPTVNFAELKIAKQNPPIKGKIGAVAVVLNEQFN